MNAFHLLIRLFEEAGYHKEKQVRLKRLSFVAPPPGTYRLDSYYSVGCKAYLTTRRNDTGNTSFLEFFVEDTKVNVYQDLVSNMVVDLSDPQSINQIKDLI